MTIQEISKKYPHLQFITSIQGGIMPSGHDVYKYTVTAADTSTKNEVLSSTFYLGANQTHEALLIFDHALTRLSENRNTGSRTNDLGEGGIDVPLVG